jgi:regulator of sirC expression with transglutaminase-like and TPR domain
MTQYTMLKPLDYFASLVQEEEQVPLFEAALSIAQDDDPALNMNDCILEIDKFAARLRRRMPADIAQIPKLRLLNNFFYQELGFAGNLNDYYNPDNSYLHKVLSTRRGIPITLAMIYMEIAGQIGLDVKGISFPGHFLMKLTVKNGDIILDPFNGASLSREDLEERLEPYFIHGRSAEDPPLTSYLADATPHTILVRMLRNLKALFAEHPHWRQFLNVQQRLVILLPHEIAERRDRGLAYANLDCPQAALQDIEAYLTECPQASDADLLRRRLPELRAATRKLN